MMCNNEPTQTIPQYFAGKNVLVTGATGFMGMVLVEKLLRSCPDVGNIYVLIRKKKGIAAQDRWNKTVDCELFKMLKKTKQMEKIITIEGDASELGLGLNAENKKELIENVAIVYHTAATVRFNESLKQALLLNTRGTREICNLILEMKKVEAFLHVSTAYCQIGNEPLEEKLYAPRGNPDEAIKLAETMDENSLKLISSKYCAGFPNTYTFTKCLAETLTYHRYWQRLFAFLKTALMNVLVTPSMKDPFPGWLTNFNGPVGICLATFKGLLRTMNVEGTELLDYIPVDSAIAAMIKSIWLKSTDKDNNISVYNCSNRNLFTVTMKVHDKAIDDVEKEKVWCKPMFVPNIYATTSYWLYWIHVYIFQLLPASLVDTVLKIAGQKPMLILIQAKLLSALAAVLPFNGKTWIFNNDNFIDLDKHLMIDDQKAFANEMASIDLTEYMFKNFLSVLKLVREDKNTEKNYVMFKRVKFLYYVWNTTMISILGYWAFNNLAMPWIHSIFF